MRVTFLLVLVFVVTSILINIGDTFAQSNNQTEPNVEDQTTDVQKDKKPLKENAKEKNTKSNKPKERYRPSEEISEDTSVPFPVDI